MLTNHCEKKHVVLLINQKDYVLYNQQTSTNKIRFTPALSEAEGRYEMRTMNYWHLTTGNWRLTTSHELPATSDKQPATSDALRKDQRAQKNLFMQNKPNFPRFCAKNGYLGEKQTQFKANSKPIKPIFTPYAPKINPIKPNFKPVPRCSSAILHYFALFYTFSHFFTR